MQSNVAFKVEKLIAVTLTLSEETVHATVYHYFSELSVDVQ